MEQLPEFKPRHWGVIEPINLELEIAEVRDFLGDGENGIMWKRKSPPKGWGDFKKRTDPLRGPQFARHGMQVTAEKASRVDALIGYIKQLESRFGVEYAFCDSVAAEYKMIGFANGFAPTAGNIYVFTHTLSEKLPDILWSQIFGPAYVRLFGLDKLLSAPAYRVEQLADEVVYLQLSESLFDMHELYAEVDAVRQRVKEHLDDNIFFDPRNAKDHVYRVPQFEFSN
ncbi:hypothetical protein [Achromobacter denitrificans]|uniref:Uncharacterized protein n=1 Tax=Achromobacter denitrificans TaxID=32002 RepID=A0ABZ3GB62_ACHDE|nr:hypothetical protein [Achromobacter denitrificans]MDF3848005.1 hypothetical protein [Achromobacter denitrificans]